jgi:hypothetical protein
MRVFVVPVPKHMGAKKRLPFVPKTYHIKIPFSRDAVVEVMD